MSAFQVESCFGVELNSGFFNLDEIIDQFGIRSEVLNHKRIRSLIRAQGKKSRIVSVAMRQVIFDLVKPALETDLLPYDPSFTFEKLLNTKRERLYDAQERFLLLCYSMTQGKTVKSLKKLHASLTTKDWRDKANEGRSLFKYFRQELDDNTREYILAYKAKQGDKVKQVEEEVDESQKNASASVPPRRRNKVSLAEKKLAPTSFNDEVVKALKLFEDGYLLLREQTDIVKTGSPLDVDKLRDFCQRLIQSHTRNSFALLAIRHIKDASTYLEQHAIGAAVLGIHFAKALALSAPYIEAIALGGLLFDLGRFRLPMAISHKAGKMTEAEFDLFRKHITFGEQMFKLSDNIPKVVYQMLIDHHERVDGAGYPHGKQDQEISVYGKIAGIIDAYDALTSQQVHKPSMGPLRARQQLIKEAGLAFDKSLLGVFLKSIGRIPVGSCIVLSNGRVGFVLTLNASLEPALIRQVYSLTHKSFITVSDIDLSKPGYSQESTKIVRDIAPQSLGIQFINYLA
ncbi:Cyclic di-GMP phosphodiesterase response regulator RpfG [Marinomonas spartinae]|uniref:HD-GYP domain-containing protein n=1 Tax=Marinomonas spartinae TaxID=1792290 RepID=UPI0008090E85|nr:HD domain-containing phosphohydrolase [Marinomonas spartinae]SBS28584.1 Cyclic di-GMP phosphodiesterase response regulator RpfG [Marinomonas spartinae]